MSGGNEREDVYEAAKAYGWSIDTKPNKSGYLKMKCGCGKHMSWLHKTPSDPGYYRNRVKFMRRTCPGGASVRDTA